MNRFQSSVLVLSVLALSACGGSDSTTQYGTVIGVPSTPVIVTKASIDTGAARSIAGAARCDVKITSVQYSTVGARSEGTTATTAIMLPSGDASCTNNLPVLVYAHGTSIDKTFSMIDVSSKNPEAALVMAMYAAQGFIVVAPNYTGYTGSSLTYHPYLHAQGQANDLINALRAARSSFASLGVSASDKLFITGYSQGGYVAMATHREMQTNNSSEFKVTASGPMSGPYALEKFSQTIFSGTVNGGATVFTPLLIDSYQNAYANIYTRTSEIYASPYDSGIVGLFPTTDQPTIDAFGSNKLPANLFFSAIGAPYLIKPSFRTDFQTNPANSFRIAVQKNDLLDFKPTSPVALCYGGADPVVFKLNSEESAAAMQTLGAGALVTRFNLEDASTIPVPAVKGGFDAQKAALTAAGTAERDYHGALVPPFCNALIRGVFSRLL
jgi:alpha-beta hydrolase superfamily lysophospholipase